MIHTHFIVKHNDLVICEVAVTGQSSTLLMMIDTAMRDVDWLTVLGLRDTAAGMSRWADVRFEYRVSELPDR